MNTLLTKEMFLAYLLNPDRGSHQMYPHWLITRVQTRKAAIAYAEEKYAEWVERETKQAAARDGFKQALNIK